MVILRKFPKTSGKDFGDRIRNRPKANKDGKTMAELINEAAKKESDNGRLWWIEQYIKHAYKKNFKSKRR